MWLLKMLITLPLMVLFVFFLVQNNELVDLWPVPDLKIAVSVVYFVLFCLGYVCGRISGWSASAPVRAKLKAQKKENKLLSKEKVKLNTEHEKLNNQITTLKEEVIKSDKASGFSLNRKIKGWFSKSSDDDR